LEPIELFIYYDKRDMPATLKDIAARVGKSVTTVSRALNDFDDVSPETKALVLEVAEELDYRPHTYAQRLQKRRSETIGFIIPTLGLRFSDPFFSEFLAGIGNKATLLGYDLLVSTQSPEELGHEAYRRMLEGGRVDGFIMVRIHRHDSRIDYLLSRNVSFIAFGCVEGKNNFPFVDEDGAHGMRLVADHLVHQGFSNIACIAPNPELTFTGRRVEGLRAGLAEHGITLDMSQVMTSDLTQRGGYEQSKNLLSSNNPPTAIVACNDLMAFGAMSAAQELGLTVGRDVAITGFDDVPMAAYSHPPLTTIHQPIYKIGGMVCEMLINIIEGDRLEEEQIILSPTLVVRQSCGETVNLEPEPYKEGLSKEHQL
jgi:LacI family transcriptional regulator